MQHQAALEVQEQVLAVGVMRVTARPARRSGQRPGGGAGREDLVRNPAVEHGAEPLGRPGDRVALRH